MHPIITTLIAWYVGALLHSSSSWKKKASNDKLASAHLFTIVRTPPRLKILILFMTFNIL